MVEKYRGILPPGSTWFRLNQEEAVRLLESNEQFESLFPEDYKELDSIDILAIRGKVDEIERILTDASLDIITLHD